MIDNRITLHIMRGEYRKELTLALTKVNFYFISSASAAEYSPIPTELKSNPFVLRKDWA